MDLTTDKRIIASNRRRNATRNNTLLVNSILDAYIQDVKVQPPASPASLSTSQTGDTAFEPSIDMMVNDFDDEQTLTEEEALAELEAQDPADEIATLQRESEIPLEELLAHYTQHIEQNHHHRRQKKKKFRNKSRKSSSKSHYKNNSSAVTAAATRCNSSPFTEVDEVIVIEESDDEVELLNTEHSHRDHVRDDDSQRSIEKEGQEAADGEDADDLEFPDHTGEFTRRSHLLELYPEKFANNYRKSDGDLTEEEDEDADLEYVKKTIMVGSAYQATIPVGLSQYGDILPYENEDKLIWEPSQVSELEVEDYLIHVREIKSPSQEEEIVSSSVSVTSESDQGVGSNLVKDDEQALHLLVQCGYNFREALRRKRLNAVPLTGSMSLWSEEECRNFEEGIQKFGKNFRKIRETQVRTRSIRELIQFYYLWKKTDRRDQDFVDSDTIDHMDLYLDFDERETVSNGGAKHASSLLLRSDNQVANQTTKKHHHKQHHGPTATSPPTLSNFSIMNENKRGATAAAAAVASNHSKKLSSNSGMKKTTLTCLSSSLSGGGGFSTAFSSDYRRRNSFLSVNKTHYNDANDANNTANSTLNSSSQTANGWQQNANSTSSIPPIITNTPSANYWSKN